MKPVANEHPESYQQAIAYLYDRINYEKGTDRPVGRNDFRLSRMERLLVELGNPQQAAPVIHIAGSKGKGSVAWLMAETLRRCGYRTGLYTSPHLVALEERFVIDGRKIEPSRLMEGVRAVRPAAERIDAQGDGRATFFELTTAIAWWLFRDAGVDVNIIEVGLGGRLDSTNVCWPALSIITSISYDHQQQLGETLAEIAAEKGGIIKPGVPVVSGAIHPEAADVILRMAKERGSKLRLLGRDFTAAKSPIKSPDGKPPAIRFDYRPSPEEWPAAAPRTGMRLRMLGEHQVTNAGLVLAGLDILREHGWKIDAKAVDEGLAVTQLPCRIEIVREAPTTILDTAHNEASIQALIDTLDQHFPQPQRRLLVFSASRDKKWKVLLYQLLKSFDTIVLTAFQLNPRAVAGRDLLETAQALLREHPPGTFRATRLQLADTPAEALSAAQAQAATDDLLVITGSFFLAAELLPSFPATP